MMPWLVGLIVLYLMTWAVIPFVLLSPKRPASMLAWILGTLFIPFIVPALFLIVGTDRLRRRRLQRHRRPDGSKVREDLTYRFGLSPIEQQMARAIASINRIPLTGVGTVKLLRNAATYYPDVLAGVRRARHHVHWQVYVWRDDAAGREFLAALVDAARRGIKVRLLVDELGSIEVSESFFQPLVDAGGEFSWFYTVHPRRNRYFLNLRNHRKLQVVDGREAWVGGMNIGREYQGGDPEVGEWLDLQVRVDGPAVAGLQEVFRNDWYFATEREFAGDRYFPATDVPAALPALLVESGPDSMRKPFLKSLLALCATAEERIDLFTPYFLPVSSLVDALQVAAARGLCVRLMVSEKNDHRFLVRIGRSYYEELMAFGVEIYEYSAAVHHAKTVIVDDRWLMVGSANLDVRSIDLNFELNLVLRAPEACRALNEIHAGMFAQSRRLDPEVFARRPRREKLAEGLSRLWAPLL